MAGLKLIIPTTGSSGPVIRSDAILTNGSLVLTDLTHSTNPLPAGVPLNGASIPNIAWKEAAALFGSGDINTLASTFIDDHQAVDAIFERTGKGGLHGIYSQVNQTASTRGAAIDAALAIKTWLFNHQTDDYYFSTWTHRTRVALTTGGQAPRLVSIDDTANFGGDYLVAMDTSGNRPAAGDGSAMSNGANAVGNSRRSVESDGFSQGNGIASPSAIEVLMMIWGNIGPGVTVWKNLAASDIFYRCYLEDLSVSGRSYATVDAIDSALFTQRVLTAGGAYYGDTFTDPATFP